MTVCPAPPSGVATLRAGNYTITLVAACAFAVQMLLDPGAKYLSSLVLEKWSLPGLFGHMWLHMTALHLLENLATLWIFGYAVCRLLGNVAYVLAYVIMGVAGGMTHVVCDGRPAIGASGAVMGIFGMYVVICFGQFGRLGPWLVLAWFLATLGAGLIGGLPGAYLDHAGAFLCGMLLAFCLVIFRMVKSDRTDPALLAILPRAKAKEQGQTT